MFDGNGIFCIESGREERWPPKFVRHGQVYIKSWQCLRRVCACSLFKNNGILREFFELQFKPNYKVCVRSMLVAKMSVIQTRNYILKCANSSVPKWHVIKTKHTCREVSPGLDAPRVAGRFPLKNLS